MVITGITIMPPTGGTIPLNQSVEQYQQEQRNAVVNSNGFKLAIAGTAITILTLILLARIYMFEEEVELGQIRRTQVTPYPSLQQVKPQVNPQVKPLEELKEIVVVKEYPKPSITHELTAPVYTIPPRLTMPPRTYIRTFKYPPPYDAFNKK